MLPKRYSFIVADRFSGSLHRFTVAVRPAIAILAAILAIPIGWTAHSRWSAATHIQHLQLRNATLELENARYRSASAELSSRIAAVQLALGELRDQSIVDPRVRRAMGRVSESSAPLRSIALSTPTETFNLLQDLLNMLDAELVVAGKSVEAQQALAAATPFNLPSDGRVTDRFGYRIDPFTGERSFHSAVDISTGYGQPVYATADGTVVSAGRSGAFGNLIRIDHGFGLITRYGHLSDFATTAGETVARGDVIGYAGATGRATGSHVHYEVLVNGRAMNPLQLGSLARSQSAN